MLDGLFFSPFHGSLETLLLHGNQFGQYDIALEWEALGSMGFGMGVNPVPTTRNLSLTISLSDPLEGPGFLGNAAFTCDSRFCWAKQVKMLSFFTQGGQTFNFYLRVLSHIEFRLTIL